MLPSFILGTFGSINIPLNFLASVGLHVNAVVLLLQYILSHRKSTDRCPRCPSPWHPDDGRDTFHHRHSSRTGQWWRETVMGQNHIAPIRSPLGSAPRQQMQFTPVTSKFSVEKTEMSSAKVGTQRQSIKQPSMRQVELTAAVFLPRLALRPVQTYGPTNRSEISPESKSDLFRSPRIRRISRHLILPPPDPALTSAPQILPTETDDFSLKQTRPISENHDSIQSARPIIFPTRRSHKSTSLSSSFRSSRIQIRKLPRANSIHLDGDMTPSRPAPVPPLLASISRASQEKREAVRHFIWG